MMQAVVVVQGAGWNVVSMNGIPSEHYSSLPTHDMLHSSDQLSTTATLPDTTLTCLQLKVSELIIQVILISG